MRLFLFLFLPCSLLAQSRYPGLPSIPLNSKLEVSYEGVWPKAAYQEGQPKEQKFKRIETQPPRLKLLVRADCDQRVGQQELIQKAKNLSSTDGQVVEIDWEHVTDEKVVFYAVVYFEKRVTRYNLVAKDDKYQVASSSVQIYPSWQTAKLQFPSGQACVREKDIEIRTMKVTILNLLNRLGIYNLNTSVPD